jgi:hypothetical protein
LDSGDQYGGKMTSKATVTVAAIDEAMRAEWCHHHVIFAGTAQAPRIAAKTNVSCGTTKAG